MEGGKNKDEGKEDKVKDHKEKDDGKTEDGKKNCKKSRGVESASLDDAKISSTSHSLPMGKTSFRPSLENPKFSTNTQPTASRIYTEHLDDSIYLH